MTEPRKLSPLEDRLAQATFAAGKYVQLSADIADMLRILMEPCRELLRGHIEDGIPEEAWDRSEYRIRDVLQAIHNHRLSLDGKDPEPNTRWFIRGVDRKLQLP